MGKNKGKKITESKIAPKLPINVNLTAIKPCPCKSILCPGSTPRAVSDSGAPKKIEGIESIKECVTDIEIIKTAKTKGLVYSKKSGETETSITERRFIWIPGVRPVKVPEATPRAIAIKISANIG